MASSKALRRSGLIAMAVGLALGAVSIAMFAGPDSQPAGDATRVESSLREAPSDPVTMSTSPTTRRPSPLWEPNESPGGSIVTGPEPVGVRIEAIGVGAPVVPHGVDQESGQMDVPDNTQDVAWYRHGPTPGRPGSSVLAAHVDLYGHGPGVFFHLDDLEPGDLVHVDFDDGTQATFTVEARVTYAKQDLPLDVIFSKDGPAVLTLVTCGGGFDRKDSRYDSNVVVYAVPVPDGAADRHPRETGDYPPHAYSRRTP